MEFKDTIAMLHMGRLMSTFGPDFSESQTQKMWYAKLKHIPLDDFKAAMSALTGNREFPPLNAFLDFYKQKNNTHEIPPDEAFALLWNKISSVGSYGQPELPNEIGLAVERLGGWKYICNNWTDDKKTWHEKAFKEIYQNITESKVKGLLSQRSKYAPQALEGGQPKQIPQKAQKALKMAMAASERSKPKLTDIMANIKKDLGEARK